MAFQASMRFTGINTGFDTDAMVKNMMTAENMRLSTMKKTMMLDTYRQEQYQSLYNDLKTFQKDFLDVMKGGSLRSGGTFSSLMSVKDANGEASKAVSIGENSAKGEYTVNVHQLAATDLYESRSKIGGSISSASGFEFDVSSIGKGASYDFTLDGVTRRIAFNEGDGIGEGWTLTFEGGKIGMKSPTGTTTALDEGQFMQLFNFRLGNAFGMDGIGENSRQKIEAKLTEDGGVMFTTNGFHTGFTMANGNYSFASATGVKQAGNLASKAELGLRVSTGSTTADIKVNTIGKTNQEIIEELNTQLAEAGVGSQVSASLEGGKVKFTNYSTTSRLTISDSLDGAGTMELLGHTGTVSLAAGGGLSNLGITSGTSAKMNANSTLGQVFGDSLTDERVFTINGTTFNFSANTSIKDVINGVNNANVGVKMSYDTYSETFKLESTETGYVNKIELSGELLTDNLGFGTEAKRAATDAVVTVNGTTLTLGTNDFRFQGVDWTLNKVTEDELTVSSATDVDKAMESIKGFVEGYNALVAKLREATGTMRPKSKGAYFDPLTDEERADMKEADIKLWDEKAKTGLLFNDSIIEGIETALRSALNQSVTMPDGSKLSLASIGVTTTRDWTKGGELDIPDETKLREAIEKYGDQIGTLFTSAAEGNKGLAERVNDVITNSISSTGPIARKAGIKGTYTETDNEIFRRLKSQNDAIEQMMEKLAQKEENYYLKFSKIEAAMSQANSQMQYVQSMFGGGA